MIQAHYIIVYFTSNATTDVTGGTSPQPRDWVPLIQTKSNYQIKKKKEIPGGKMNALAEAPPQINRARFQSQVSGSTSNKFCQIHPDQGLITELQILRKF